MESLQDWRTLDGMFIKMFPLMRAGDLIPQHSHVWDHSTLLARGRLILWGKGKPIREYSAPAIIFIPAGVGHEFQIMEDDTLVFCLHNLAHGDVPAILAENGLESFADAS